MIRALRDADVPPDRLIVEVTETALLIDPEQAARVLAELADAGVKISLDDFGRGQTSLGYLSALPVHELKIDRSLVSDMCQNPAHAAIVRSMIELGHNLSMRVVAEGIETEDVLADLGEYGCDLAQGYLLARPMTLAQLEQWLTDRGPRRSPGVPQRQDPRAAAQVGGLGREDALGDVGNWLDTLGMISLFIELSVISLGLTRLALHRPPAPPAR